MGNTSGKTAARRGYSSPGIVRNSRAAHDMSKAWSTGRGKSAVSRNQSRGARWTNSHNK